LWKGGMWGQLEVEIRRGRKNESKRGSRRRRKRKRKRDRQTDGERGRGGEERGGWGRAGAGGLRCVRSEVPKRVGEKVGKEEVV